MSRPENDTPDTGASTNRVDAALSRADDVLKRHGIHNPNDALVGIAAVATLSPAELHQAVREEKKNGSAGRDGITQARDDLNNDLYIINGRERTRAGVVGGFLGAAAISWAMNVVGAHYEDSLNLRLYGAMAGSTLAYVGRGILGGLRVGADRRSLARQKVEDVARYTREDTPSEGTESKGL